MPGLREVEANKALKTKAYRRRDDPNDSVMTQAGYTPTDEETEPESVTERRHRKIVDDVKCSMCGFVVEDLWVCVLTVYNLIRNQSG